MKALEKDEQKRCPFYHDTTDMMSKMEKSIKELTDLYTGKAEYLRVMNQSMVTLTDEVRSNRAILNQLPSKIDTLTEVIDKFGMGFLHLFKWIGGGILAVVVVMGLIVIWQSKMTIDSSVVKINASSPKIEVEPSKP